MIENKMKTFFVIGMMLSLANLAYAGTNYSYKQSDANLIYNNAGNVQTSMYPQDNVLRGNVVMVPAGTGVNAALTCPLSSATMSVGQTVTMALSGDFNYDGRIIAPAGSTVTGTVIESSNAKRGGINGKLSVRFNMITTPYGTQIPISAVIKTDDSTGVLVGGTKMDVTKEYAKDLAAGSAAGALSGVIFGALAGGSVGRGAALGTAVGAGGGLVKSVWDKGKDVEIPMGASVELQLTQPITVSVPAYQFEN